MRKHFIVVGADGRAVMGSDKQPRRYGNVKRAGRVAARLAYKSPKRVVGLYHFVGHLKVTPKAEVYVTAKGRKAGPRRK